MEVLGLINYGDFFLDIWFFKIDWKCVSVYLIDFYWILRSFVEKWYGIGKICLVLNLWSEIEIVYEREDLCFKFL